MLLQLLYDENCQNLVSYKSSFKCEVLLSEIICMIGVTLYVC